MLGNEVEKVLVLLVIVICILYGLFGGNAPAKKQ